MMDDTSSGTSAALKRQREPLSDAEDNVLFSADFNDSQKRRRLDVIGQENRSPKPSSFSRQAELDVKGDTPNIVSVRSRVQQLTQYREGGPLLAQRCLSDPGSDTPSIIIQDKTFKEHLLGEVEFSQRVERFRAANLQPSPARTPNPANPSSLTLSSAVTCIQQRLQGSTTPSSKQASRLRQERDEELRLLCSQPISDNAWLKRSMSDPSLNEVDGDEDDGPFPAGVSATKDGSFTQALVSGTGAPDAADDTLGRQCEADASGHDETNTAEMIDQMFEEVLEAAGQTAEKGEEGGGADEHDSGIVPGSGEKKMKKRERQEEERACEGTKEEEDTSGDEMLTFPRCGILSPLSKSVETVVTPMRLAAGQLSNTPSLLLSPDDDVTPGPADSAPLYSIDAYRTQRQKKLPAIQSVTPSVQRRGQEKSRPQPSVNTKERIAGLNEEAGKLQTVISQTLQALSCCTDEGHGRGSMEEAEAEKLLLVSSEKRSALLSEVARLKETDSVEPDESDGDYIAQQPCRGTVGISQVQLPLKVEFVCSSRNRTGRPSHYFFVLIRYGSCNIVATPLATALDALNGDTITFSTSVTLQDIRPSFEIDVEVYSLSHTSSSAGTVERGSTKSRLTPRKILKTMKKSNPSSTSSALPALNTRRSSNFSLVGSHKITLASLGQSKFPLDKMKFEGKIRRLLGDEFQEKVPFLSPLEGNIYLHLDSHGHSNVQHQGFLTMFEVINGFGAWHRRFFVLEGEQMSYWNHPNDRGSKLPEGSISLSSASSQTVKPVKRDSCARPFTFELVSDLQSQEPDDLSTKAKCWFSADTKEERSDWTEKLNQVLLDLHTWTRRVPAHSDAEVSQTTSTSSFSSTISTIRESTL